MNLFISSKFRTPPSLSSTPLLPYLTVGDMLYRFYKTLRTSVEPRGSVSRAFKKRLRADPNIHDKNVRHGVRQIDYLGEAGQFIGLRPAGSAELPSGKRHGEDFLVQLSPAG